MPFYLAHEYDEDSADVYLDLGEPFETYEEAQVSLAMYFEWLKSPSTVERLPTKVYIVWLVNSYKPEQTIPSLVAPGIN